MTFAVDDFITLVTLVIVFAPVALNLIKYLGAATHNKAVMTLADRALIIVTALDNMLIENTSKKKEALDKLLSYASETGVKLTSEQASDYIEHAVQELRRLQQSQPKEVTEYDPEEK